MQAFYRQVGKRIAQLRDKEGLSQQELADKLFLSKDTVANIEQGVTGIRLDRAHTIATLFKVTVNDLLALPRT